MLEAAEPFERGDECAVSEGVPLCFFCCLSSGRLSSELPPTLLLGFLELCEELLECEDSLLRVCSPAWLWIQGGGAEFPSSGAWSGCLWSCTSVSDVTLWRLSHPAALVPGPWGGCFAWALWSRFLLFCDSERFIPPAEETRFAGTKPGFFAMAVSEGNGLCFAILFAILLLRALNLELLRNMHR